MTSSSASATPATMSWQRWLEDESRKKDHPVTTKMIVAAVLKKIRLKYLIPALVRRLLLVLGLFFTSRLIVYLEWCLNIVLNSSHVVSVGLHVKRVKMRARKYSI